MSHKLYKVVDYKVLDRYTLWVKFDDESEQVINLEPVLYGEMWGPLRDLTLFKQVTIDTGGSPRMASPLNTPLPLLHPSTHFKFILHQLIKRDSKEISDLQNRGGVGCLFALSEA